MELHYVLMNPSGNRTILVETPVAKKDYKKIATGLMKAEPTAEQVGFLDIADPNAYKLTMAGGEFCGNATMCTHVLCESRKAGLKKIRNVEGTAEMPGILGIKKRELIFEKKTYVFPVVEMDGISHVIAELSKNTVAEDFAGESEEIRFLAENVQSACKKWVKDLKVKCLGILFISKNQKVLKPFVYVKSPESAVWESACGSGSVAAASYLHKGEKEWVHTFKEPGGSLTVKKEKRKTYLCGKVTLEKEGVFSFSEKSAASLQVEKNPKPEKKRKAKTTKSAKAGQEKDLQDRIKAVLARLDERYGTDYRCYLHYETPWQLLFSTIMSAQCTDERVNIVTKDLYVKYKSLEDFAKADLKELEQDIHSTGFYHNKAKNIIACAKVLLEKYNGEVPSDIESLTSLPGVGRKTANVIRGNIYHIDSIVVDTHVKRISKKLGFTEEEDPEKVEFDLMKKLPEDHWILYNIHIITLGRSICKAPTPKCEECFLKDLCPSYKK